MNIREILDTTFSSGNRIILSGNHPHRSTAPALFLVEQGEVDLFYIRERGDLLAIETCTSSTVFCLPAGMQISGKEGSCIRELKLSELTLTLEAADIVFNDITAFINTLSQKFLPAIPLGKTAEETGNRLTAGEILRSPNHAQLLSIRGSAEYTDTLSLTGSNNILLSRSSWIKATSEVEIIPSIIDGDNLLPAIKTTCSFIHLLLDNFSQQLTQEWAERQKNSQESAAQVFRKTLHNLSQVMESSSTYSHATTDELTTVCLIVANASGNALNDSDAARSSSVEDFASRHGIRTRRVRLEKDWYNNDCGALVAWLADTPVALIPQSSGYEYIIPGEAPKKVTAKIAPEFDQWGWSLFARLPNSNVKRRDILKLAWRGGLHDLQWILLMGIITGLLGMITPGVTGLIISHVIPSGEYNMLFELGLILLSATIASTLFDLVQNFALVRFSSRSSSLLQGAIWDRLLSLPASFFAKYQTGDLVNRAQGIIAIKDIITGHLISSSMAIAVGSFNIIIALYYSWQLTLIVCGFSIISIVINFFLSLYQLKFQRLLQKVGGEFQGFVLQVITAISKIRVSGSEIRVFAQLSKLFMKQTKFSYDYSIFAQITSILFSIMPLLQTAIIFYVIVKMDPDKRLSVGSYMAFTAASAQMTRALNAVSDLALAVIKALPHYERAKPILDATVEYDNTRKESISLKGSLELRGVNFAYGDETNTISEVSLKANPGEFIAIVGASGAGKSTLLKLLLGLEKPKSGIILFDEIDISTFNIKSLRKQFGVVLQNGGIMQGSIYSNICGASILTYDEAWEALRLAGLHREVAEMPMNIQTILPQGAGVLSGGQQQRLMIARALAAKPQILFFDEATSALDNRLQREVSQNIEALSLTRIVIAHRLSTIRNADKIYVMDKGRIVQEGTYNELIQDQDNIFADLCRRQEQ